jgi:hypothetical protein
MVAVAEGSPHAWVDVGQGAWGLVETTGGVAPRDLGPSLEYLLADSNARSIEDGSQCGDGEASRRA